MSIHSSLSDAALRPREIDRLRQHLEVSDFPRLKMMLIVGLTGAAGFLASYLALDAGLLSMRLRYPLAVGVAYLVFLFLLWLWLRTQPEDCDDLSPDQLTSGHGGGGSCGGGSGGSGDAGIGDVADAASGADEFAIPLSVRAPPRDRVITRPRRGAAQPAGT